jgi:hypothetical protein
MIATKLLNCINLLLVGNRKKENLHFTTQQFLFQNFSSSCIFVKFDFYLFFQTQPNKEGAKGKKMQHEIKLIREFHPSRWLGDEKWMHQNENWARDWFGTQRQLCIQKIYKIFWKISDISNFSLSQQKMMDAVQAIYNSYTSDVRENMIHDSAASGGTLSSDSPGFIRDFLDSRSRHDIESWLQSVNAANSNGGAGEDGETVPLETRLPRPPGLTEAKMENFAHQRRLMRATYLSIATLDYFVLQKKTSRVNYVRSTAAVCCTVALSLNLISEYRLAYTAMFEGLVLNGSDGKKKIDEQSYHGRKMAEIFQLMQSNFNIPTLYELQETLVHNLYLSHTTRDKRESQYQRWLGTSARMGRATGYAEQRAQYHLCIPPTEEAASLPNIQMITASGDSCSPRMKLAFWELWFFELVRHMYTNDLDIVCLDPIVFCTAALEAIRRNAFSDASVDHFEKSVIRGIIKDEIEKHGAQSLSNYEKLVQNLYEIALGSAN